MITRETLLHPHAHLTVLFDETDRGNTTKLNCLTSANFDGALLPSPASGGVPIPARLSEYASTARLVNMLDFSRVTFDKQIALTVKQPTVLQSKWPLEKLGDMVQAN